MASIRDSLTFKILVIGDGAVGKTSLVRWLCHEEFSESMEQTIGVEFMSYMLEIDGKPVKLQIWDTAGQEQYHSIGKVYYRNAVGVLCVFALNSHDSFVHIGKWLSDVRALCNPNARIILIGNKSDLIDQRSVTQEEINGVLDGYGVEYIESSAKTGDNVSQAFFTLSQHIFMAVNSGDIILPNTSRDTVNANTPVKEDKKCC